MFVTGENGRVHYTIRQSNPGNVFDVNMTSGEIYSALYVDYEVKTEHWLVVQAVDSSLEGPQGTTINVTVSVYLFNLALGLGFASFKLLSWLNIGREKYIIYIYISYPCKPQTHFEILNYLNFNAVI